MLGSPNPNIIVMCYKHDEGDLKKIHCQDEEEEEEEEEDLIFPIDS